nr:hypothetical protein [uncultured Psychroserpens sp.]
MKNLLLFLSLILLCSCDSDDDNETFTLENRVYQVIAFEVESNMDLNGDGIFSTDLLSELEPFQSALLSQLRMRFLEDGTAYYPWYDWPYFNVVDGEQISGTAALSSTSLPYRLSETNVTFTNGDVILNGEFMNNGNTIVTSYNPNDLYDFNNDEFAGVFINEMGEVETYEGNFILTLELQN